MSRVIFICLIGLLIPTFAWGQDKISFRYDQSGNQDWSPFITLEVKGYIVFQPLSTRNNQRRLSGKNLATNLPSSAVLRLEFEPLDSESYNLINRKDVTISLVSTGSLKVSQDNVTLRIGNRRRDYVDINLVSSGIGKLSIQVAGTAMGKVRSIDEKNRLDLTYEVISFQDEYNRIKKLPESQVRERVSGLGRLHDLFPAFGSSEYDGVADVSAVRLGLRKVREDLDQLHDTYQGQAMANPNKLEGIRRYYQVFGNQTGKTLASYSTSANDALAKLDDQSWASVDKNDIPSLEAYLTKWKNTGLAYQPKHQKEATQGIEAGIATLLASARGKDCSNFDFQALLSQLELTAYYESNSNDPRFEIIRNKVDECGGPDCESLYQAARKRQSRSACIRFLNACPDAPANQVNAIQRILDRISSCEASQAEFRTIQADTTQLLANQALIRTLLSEGLACLTPEQQSMLLRWEKRIAPLALASNEGPNKGMGGYFYLLRFASGADIELNKIDGLQDSLALAQAAGEIYQLEWLHVDSLLRLVILDQKEHWVTFKGASGDTLGIPLQQGKFSGTIQDLGDALLVKLENGNGPFILELMEGATLRFVELDGPIDTIQKADLLAQGFDGSYELAVRDFYSRKHRFSDQAALELRQESNISLWVWLIGPLLLLIGFLIYRNSRLNIPIPSSKKFTKQATS